MRKNLLSLCSISVCIFILFFMANMAAAASVKDRMAARIPAINNLKDHGKIGENNLGFLVYMSKAKPNAQLINAENKDRKLVYNAIAKQQKTSPTLVGQRRAKMIAQTGKRGHWFQRKDGSWFRK